MSNPIYLDFELTIERFGEGYRAQVSASPVGEHPTSYFRLPSTKNQPIQHQSEGTAATYRHALTTALNLPDNPRKIGQWLFETVIRDEVLVNLRSSLAVAESTQKSRLRIRLNLSNADELTSLPWEYLFDPRTNRFFCLSVDTPIVRYLNVPNRATPLAAKRPLRVLVMVAAPIDQEELDVEREWQLVNDALADLKRQRQVVVERLPTPTLAALQDALRLQEYHIFHYIGHSSIDEVTDNGVLLFEDADRYSELISGERLATILHDTRSLRLAVLNACSSGALATDDPFSGVGPILLQQGIPAVIAMQFDITDSSSLALSQAFYKALAAGYPVDAALAEGRKAIVARSDNIEWGTPVLYMHAADGQIFPVHRRFIRGLFLPLLATIGIALFIASVYLLSFPPPICREQVFELIVAPKTADIYSYIVRYRRYRDEYKFACARRDLEAALEMATTNEEKAKILYGYAALELTDNNVEQAHEISIRGLQYDQISSGITALLNLTDGLALCRLDQPLESQMRIQNFLDLSKTPLDVAPYPNDNLPLMGIQAIQNELRNGRIPKYDCWEKTLDLP